MKSIERIVSTQAKLGNKIYIFVYTIGKEEIFIWLAKLFDTKIVVDEKKMKQIKICDWEPQLFTSEPDESSFLFVWNCTELGNPELLSKLDPENDTILVLTAWKNKYRSTFKNFFWAGYSSHSNASEIEAFIKSICPKKITFHSHSDTPTAVEF